MLWILPHLGTLLDDLHFNWRESEVQKRLSVNAGPELQWVYPRGSIKPGGFAERAMPIQSILSSNTTPSSMQRPRYTSLAKLLTANTISDL